ncbi:hypothetical protein [Phreatobacter sp.]|uniref:hypothetical protein n=1 Tax=Phreatobacter sp. TaxID=1966341 RepID=UPI003F70C132
MSAPSLAGPSIAQALITEPLLIGLVLVTGLALAALLSLFVIDMLGQIRRMEAMVQPAPVKADAHARRIATRLAGMARSVGFM